MKKLLLLITALCSAAGNSPAQNITQQFTTAGDTVIISPRVGTIIDREEKIRHAILPYYSNQTFISAVFIRKPDSTIIMRATFKGDSVAEKAVSQQEFNWIKNATGGYSRQQNNGTSTLPEAAKLKPKVLGLGIKISPLRFDELTLSDFPFSNNRLIITLNPISGFRIQPEIGYYQIKEYSDNLKDHLTDKNIYWGAGVFGTWQKDRATFYTGPQVIIMKNINNYVQTTYNNNPPFNVSFLKQTVTTNFLNIGWFLGGEYFLGNHFSTGCEVGFLYSKTNIDYSDAALKSENDTFSRMMTETNLLMRFYF